MTKTTFLPPGTAATARAWSARAALFPRKQGSSVKIVREGQKKLNEQ